MTFIFFQADSETNHTILQTKNHSKLKKVLEKRFFMSYFNQKASKKRFFLTMFLKEKNMRRKLPAIILTVLMGSLLCAGPHTIIKFNGKKDRWSKDAVDYLTGYLTKSTGEKPLLNQKGKAKYTITLEITGDKKGDPETFSLKFPAKDQIVISGATSLAVRHGVCEFLERCVGVRWLYQGKNGEIIPKSKEYKTGSKTITMTPAFAVRSFAFSNQPERIWSGKHKGIFHYDYTHLPNHPWFHHALWHIVSSEKYGKTNPEFFPIQNGKRMIPAKGYNIFWQHCFTAPGIADAFAREIQAYFKKYPGRYTASFGVNDGSGYCTCKRCLGVDKDPRNRVNSYMACFDQVAKKCWKPGRTFGFLAYGRIRTVADTTKKYHSSLIPFLTYERLYWSDPARKAKDQKETLDWHKATGGNVGWYDYLSYNRFLIPKISLNVTPEALRWGAKNHVKYYYAEAYPGDWHTGPMMTIILKLLWDPQQDVYTILRNWCVDAVGKKAAVHLENYFKLCSDFWEKEVPKTPFFKNPDEKGQQYMNMGNSGYLGSLTVDMLNAMEKELNAAVAKSSGVEKERANMFLSSFKKRLPQLKGYIANSELQKKLAQYKFKTVLKHDFNKRGLWSTWQRTASKGKFYYSPDCGVDKSGAMAMDFKNSYKEMVFMRNAKIKPGHVYRATVYARNTDSLPGARMSLRIAWGAKGKSWLDPSLDKSVQVTEDGSYNWQKLTVAAKAPTDEGVFIKLIVSGGNLKEGKVFFDNFTLEEAQP